ncbi:hypothetical protein [Methylorubrum extorquens]|uniref:hypothetical protein n=1 Tax=Methylorubrum extorquens TaxID=408 RepID=UPI0002DCF3A2|nr:hypothetical protein [Methylorubrum extorquens]
MARFDSSFQSPIAQSCSFASLPRFHRSTSAREVSVRTDAYSDEAGRGFRFEAGRHSEAKPATVPI